MGCEKSKTVPIEEKRQKNRPSVEYCGGIFTDFQVDIIKSTWPLIAADLQANGEAVFLDIFTAEPQVKRLFPFRHLDGDKLMKNATFQSHTRRFMETVDAVCVTLPNLDNDCPISRRLMVLGAQHATIPGFDVIHFSIFAKCLHLTWEKVLGEEYTDDIKEAWALVFEFIMDRIRDGYFIFNQEQERYKEQQKVTNGSTAVEATT